MKLFKARLIKVQPDCLADKVNELVNGHPENYVLIDYDSHASIFLSMDHKDFRHRKCEGIDYVMCSSIGYLKDTFLYKQLVDRLILILKEDLPALIRTSDGNVDVTLDDLSNYENNCMDLRMYIDSKYIIKYRKDVNINSFEVLPMKINQNHDLVNVLAALRNTKYKNLAEFERIRDDIKINEEKYLSF